MGGGQSGRELAKTCDNAKSFVSERSRFGGEVKLLTNDVVLHTTSLDQEIH